MPRRRSTKARRAETGKPKSFTKGSAKVDRWNTAADIPMDEEDQFHASKDKILLEDNIHDGFDDGDEDEVFALKGVDEDDDDDDDEGGEFMDEDDDIEEDEEPEAPKKASKKDKLKTKGKAAQSSEDEEEESEDETWGSGKAAYYSSNAVALESDDEEGNELEEQEAKRLQSKAREDMGDDDFGLNDLPENTGKDDFEDLVKPAATTASLPTDKQSIIRHLEKTSPEALALARDWEETARNLVKVRERVERVQAEEPDALSLGMIHLHYQALLSYTTVLAFYLHLRASEKYVQRPELLDSHPILRRLLTLKQSIATLEGLDFAVSDSEDEDEDDEDEDEDEDYGMTLEEMMKDGEQLWARDEEEDDVVPLEAEELAELLMDAEESTQSTKRSKRAEKVQPPKKKRKTSSDISKSVVPVFDLEEPEFLPSKKTSSRSHADAGEADSYGEATHLQEVDAADKTARKKSLRFHTSKIESASARRQGARNQASGGDDDIPYRERKREKDARLAKEAKNRVQDQGGADLDDTEPEARVPEKRRREEDSGEEDTESPDGYYELVKKKSKEKKAQKKMEYDSAKALERPDLEEEASGPRSLTRAILKNRGLTPHRPKSVRNPRVKKRQKFEKAKKKISSQKAVYKGGISDTGRYDGERSGISKVVKSTRLG